MSFLFAPDHGFEKITDITPDFLTEHGIALLLMDLDNTISPYELHEPTEEVKAWAEDCKVRGITLFIVSNNSSSERAGKFADDLGISFVHKAGKPSRRGILHALKEFGVEKERAALVGDQIFTDVLAANRSGILSLMVEPSSLKNPLLALRYGVEIPFRILCREKHRR